MMKYLDWQKTPARFRAMTGYDLCEFNNLLPYFEEAHNDYFNMYYLDGKRRTGLRSFAIYSNSPLACIEERLAFTAYFVHSTNPL